jgi:hypothetical protein
MFKLTKTNISYNIEHSTIYKNINIHKFHNLKFHYKVSDTFLFKVSIDIGFYADWNLFQFSRFYFNYK